MIIIENLLKSYSKPIFENINISFKNNGLYLISGKSGIGKTTLLNIITGLEKPDRGNVIVNDRKIKRRVSSREISYTSQTPLFFEDKTVYENIILSLKINNNEVNDEKIIRLLNEFGLINKIHKNASDLSTGEKQRLNICRGILSDAKIMIFDEVTSNLDDNNRLIVLNKLQELSKDKIIIITSHDEVREYVDYVCNIIDKKIFIEKNKEVKKIILTSKKYREYYNILIKKEKNKINIKRVDVFFSIILFILNITFLFATAYHIGKTNIDDIKVNVHKDIIYLEGEDITKFYLENKNSNSIYILEKNDREQDTKVNITFLGDITIVMPVMPLPIDIQREKSKLKYGNLPVNNNEILIDIMVFYNSIYGKYGYLGTENNLLDVGIRNPESLINKSININNRNYIISGVVDEGSTNIYLNIDEFKNPISNKYLLIDSSINIIDGRFPVEGINEKGYYEAIISESTSKRYNINIDNIYKGFKIVGICNDTISNLDMVITYIDNIFARDLTIGASRLYITDINEFNLDNTDLKIINEFDEMKNSLILINKNKISKILFITVLLLQIIVLVFYSIIKYISNMKILCTDEFLGKNKFKIFYEYLIKKCLPISFICIIGYIFSLLILNGNYYKIIIYTNLSLNSKLPYLLIFYIFIATNIIMIIPLITYIANPLIKNIKKIK